MRPIDYVFFTFNVTVGEGDHSERVESSPTGGRFVQFLPDSRSNVCMTPHPGDLSERTSISKELTVSKKSQLQATVSDVTKLLAQDSENVVEIKIKGVLWVLELL